MTIPRMLYRVGLSFLLSIFSLNVACATARRQSSGQVPWPGREAPREASSIATTHRGGDLCTRWVSVNHVKYNFDTACGGNIVLYVQTLDKNFRSPEGLAIGRTLREAVGAGGTVREDRSDHDCGVTLPSGWIARPEMGLNTRSTTVTPCTQLLDEKIESFDTEFIEPRP